MKKIKSFSRITAIKEFYVEEDCIYFSFGPSLQSLDGILISLNGKVPDTSLLDKYLQAPHIIL